LVAALALCGGGASAGPLEEQMNLMMRGGATAASRALGAAQAGAAIGQVLRDQVDAAERSRLRREARDAEGYDRIRNRPDEARIEVDCAVYGCFRPDSGPLRTAPATERQPEGPYLYRDRFGDE
jgi:hypothetical protein